MTEDLEQLARSVVELAIEKKLLIATAESLTGGMLGNLLCTVAGASATFTGGVISYSNEVKQQVLGVDSALLSQKGSVDPDVAEQMAAGSARVCGADLAISTTGVAGPDSHDGKPVGRVYVGISSARGTLNISRDYEGSRQAIREQAAYDALRMLLAELEQDGA